MRPRILGAALIVVAACAGGPADDRLGAALDPQVTGPYCIAEVRELPRTVHFTGLPWLLDSAEAEGKITVTNNVGVFVQPTMLSTVTSLQPQDVTRVVGYNMNARYDLIAVSTATIEMFEKSRLEAYSSFVESTWEVRDAACGAVIGTGASFEPSGVFFQTVPAQHRTLPDIDLYGLVQGCEDLRCTSLPGLEGEADAGAPAATAAAGELTRRALAFIPTMVNPFLGGSPAEERH